MLRYEYTIFKNHFPIVKHLVLSFHILKYYKYYFKLIILNLLYYFKLIINNHIYISLFSFLINVREILRKWKLN